MGARKGAAGLASELGAQGLLTSIPKFRKVGGARRSHCLWTCERRNTCVSNGAVTLSEAANALERQSTYRKVSNAIVHVCVFALQDGRTGLVKKMLHKVVTPPHTEPSMASVQLKCLQCIICLCLVNFGKTRFLDILRCPIHSEK